MATQTMTKIKETVNMRKYEKMVEDSCYGIFFNQLNESNKY